jgi:two-component system response regulator DesR
LKALLSQEEDMRVVAEAARLADVLPTARRVRSDVMVLDVEFTGIVEVNTLYDTLYELEPDIKVLILMDRWIGNHAVLAKLAPQVGLLATDSSPGQLLDGIRRLAASKPVLDIDLAVAALTAEDNPLTEREREVLRLSVEGAPAKAIAAELFLSIGTVRNYLSRAVTKTGGRTRIEAARIARDEGWI